ncbi:29 kDa ribonucleoprotein, chloroplastic-like isoform X1 [Nilaparvata lugens]|uniref:29 kDa ribonucleoprotein, chloroplastic-like isoform X1 n=1 Tax=Nilaparvata lugens TaxID=108931 RepID=UPI00193D06BB|nr:29 kDa ribonucleoprotein, chloroplastic-like isoform X1 [Nilaparvata lugens]
MTIQEGEGVTMEEAGTTASAEVVAVVVGVEAEGGGTIARTGVAEVVTTTTMMKTEVALGEAEGDVVAVEAVVAATMARMEAAAEGGTMRTGWLRRRWRRYESRRGGGYGGGRGGRGGRGGGGYGGGDDDDDSRGGGYGAAEEDVVAVEAVAMEAATMMTAEVDTEAAEADVVVAVEADLAAVVVASEAAAKTVVRFISIIHARLYYQS